MPWHCSEMSLKVFVLKCYLTLFFQLSPKQSDNLSDLQKSCGDHANGLLDDTGQVLAYSNPCTTVTEYSIGIRRLGMGRNIRGPWVRAYSLCFLHISRDSFVK